MNTKNNRKKSILAALGAATAAVGGTGNAVRRRGRRAGGDLGHPGK